MHGLQAAKHLMRHERLQLVCLGTGDKDLEVSLSGLFVHVYILIGKQ